MIEQQQAGVSGWRLFQKTFGQVAGLTIAMSVALVGCIPRCYATDQSPFVFWRSSQLDDLENVLRLKIDTTKAAHAELVSSPGPSASVFYWGESRQGEIHQKFADFGLVRAGEGAVLIGGRLVGERITSSGDLHGRLEGGTRQRLAAGDVFYIPANTPHQWQMESGKHLYLEMLKIELKQGDAAKGHYLYWSSAQLSSREKDLKVKVDLRKSANEDLAHSDSFKIVLIHRGKSASSFARIHEKSADFQFVRSGEGVMLLGGRVVGGKHSGSGEVRGTFIEGGTKQRIATGDLLYIPPGTPHQFQAEPGKQVNVLVVRVAVKR